VLFEWKRGSLCSTINRPASPVLTSRGKGGCEDIEASVLGSDAEVGGFDAGQQRPVMCGVPVLEAVTWMLWWTRRRGRARVSNADVTGRWLPEDSGEVTKTRRSTVAERRAYECGKMRDCGERRGSCGFEAMVGYVMRSPGVSMAGL
jgi:hypothetical protein